MRSQVKQHHPRVEWDQTGFEEMKADWSAERVAADKAALEKLFSLAEDCPLLAEALEWAERHGIKFFVDQTVSGAWGYYMNGTGVIGISPNCLSETAASVAGTMVHEIRHAWQDFHGMSAFDNKGTKSFAYLFLNQALREADAYAHGEQANRQVQAARQKRRSKRFLKFGLERALPDADLGRGFLKWFSSGFYTHHYGDATSRRQGKAWGIYDGPQISYNIELPHDPEKALPTPGIDPYDIQDVMRLGAGFSGTENYLAALPREVLLKKILQPSLADTFWNASSKSERGLTTELRKAHLRKKLAHRVQPRQRIQL